MLLHRTVLGRAPLTTSLLVVAFALTCLFTIVRPEITAGFGTAMRFMFWFSHVSVGVFGILCASLFIKRLAHHNIHTFWLLILSGLLGTALVSPLFYLMESLFPFVTEDADDVLDAFAQRGAWAGILVEFIEVSPMLLCSWLMVNLPLIFTPYAGNNDFIEPPPRGADKGQSNCNEHIVNFIDKREEYERSEQGQSRHDPADKALQQHNQELQKQKQAFLNQLPAALGQDIISISSELHYLNVDTNNGRALVLGSIAKVAELFEDDGFLVHRSHWVSKVHVERVVIAGKDAYCCMSNKTSVPISRSKRKLVKAYFGTATKLNATQTSQAKSGMA